ncbi:hypothetical protein YC2023_044588 [Brassica napus]
MRDDVTKCEREQVRHPPTSTNSAQPAGSTKGKKYQQIEHPNANSDHHKTPTASLIPALNPQTSDLHPSGANVEEPVAELRPQHHAHR